MPGWVDRMLLGPARRRRRLERDLRRLEQEYAAWATVPPPPTRSGQRDVTAWVALTIALVGVLGVGLVVPEAVPAPLRSALGIGPDRLAEAPVVSGDGSYAFIQHQPGDPSTPVTYDPCRKIEVRVNPDGGPPDGVQLVREALDEVSRATGLVFRYAGTTDERPRWESESVPMFLGRVHARPVLVSWATAGEVPQLAGDVAGIGGSLAVSLGSGPRRYVTGGITFDSGSFERLADDPGGRPLMRAIVLHELGHLAGLGHVDDPRELMHAENLGRLDFGPGDRAGLAKVGSGSCS